MNLTNTPNLPFFFVIGRPRSGTTLIRTLFDAHPNVNIPLECAYINNLHHRYGSLVLFDKTSILRFVDDLKRQKSFEFWNIDEEKLLIDLLAQQGKATFSEMCKMVSAHYISAFPKEETQLLGDKNPVYAFYVSKLMKIFPEARFIVITRDYHDHVVSVLNLNLSFRNITQIVWQWKWALKTNLKLMRQFPQKFYHIKYEDFVSEPEKHFKDMTNFLGIPYTDKVFEFHLDTNARDKMYSDRFIQQWQQHLFEPISTKNIGRWKTALTPEQIMIADAVAGKYAEIMGYERRTVTFPLFLRLKLAFEILSSSIFNYKRILKDRFFFKTNNAE